MSEQLGPVAASVDSGIGMEKNDNNTQTACNAFNKKSRRNGTGNIMFSLVLIIVQLCGQVKAWGKSKNYNSEYSIYGNAASRDWLYDGSALSIQVLGCVWGVVYDSEEEGCLEDESEDGTYNWYMMANCRRPQVAYSVYSGSSCSSSSFIGSVSCFSVIKDDFFKQHRCHSLSCFTFSSALRILTNIYLDFIKCDGFCSPFRLVYDNNGSC